MDDGVVVVVVFPLFSLFSLSLSLAYILLACVVVWVVERVGKGKEKQGPDQDYRGTEGWGKHPLFCYTTKNFNCRGRQYEPDLVRSNLDLKSLSDLERGLKLRYE